MNSIVLFADTDKCLNVFIFAIEEGAAKQINNKNSDGNEKVSCKTLFFLFFFASQESFHHSLLCKVFIPSSPASP